MDNSTDCQVIGDAVEWLDEGEAVYLVTVVRTWGSAPRRPGALMVIHPDGRFTGSVSGGCVEDDLVQRVLRGEFEGRSPQLLEYGVSSAATQRIGLPCGGHLQLLMEYVDSVGPLRTLLKTMQSRRRMTRRVCLATSECSLHPAEDFQPFSVDGDTIYKTFGPAWRMLIIGAGELARRVAQLAQTLDYGVTLCDSRAEYADGWQVEGADFSSLTPARFIEDYAPDEHTVILALAHAPALEDEALVAALNSDAFYIGVLGSRKNHDGRLKRLRQLGVNSSQLSRLQGPVGLDIGSRTPAEIAISIHAALIQQRNRQSRPQLQVDVNHG